jgi:DNA-binding NtrC family response regulator
VVSTRETFSRTILESSPWLAQSSSIQRAAAAQCPLLITGETGTGKGFVARWIHANGPRGRADEPFVPVNCGAIPDSLIDSHLFGHARGSFSGATADHLGLVRSAEGGTLLLDEISELPMTAQTRLLRLLEEREVQPVGFSRPMHVNVRIIASSNKNLSEAVGRGQFREDLYFRLDVVRLHLKPLRQRSEEIEPLLAEFNAQFATMYRRDELAFDRSAMRMLESYAWPGNVRELRTVVERLYVMSSDHTITAWTLKQFAGLRADVTTSSRDGSGMNHLERKKIEAVQEVLTACRGNMSRAASTLGVHRSTLYRWLSDQPTAA